MHCSTDVDVKVLFSDTSIRLDALIWWHIYLMSNMRFTAKRGTKTSKVSNFWHVMHPIIYKREGQESTLDRVQNLSSQRVDYRFIYSIRSHIQSMNANMGTRALNLTLCRSFMPNAVAAEAGLVGRFEQIESIAECATQLDLPANYTCYIYFDITCVSSN